MTTDDLFDDEPTTVDTDMAIEDEGQEIEHQEEIEGEEISATETDADGEIEAAEGETATDDTQGDLTGVEKYLSDYGIIAGQITYEDGEKINFNDLNPEEQYNVLQSLTSEARPSIEDEYDLDDGEIELLNDIRNSGANIQEYMNTLINSHVQQTMAVRDSFDVDYTNMPDDAVFLKWLQETNTEISEEDALEALRTQKTNEGIYKSQVDNLRAQYVNMQQQYKSDRQVEENREREELLETDRYEIVTAVEKIDNIGGAQVSDQMKNEVLHSLLEINDQGDPLIMEEMFSDPERLFKAAWFMRYGESYLENVDKYWKRKESESYKRGRAEAIEGSPESTSGMSRNHVIPKPGKGAGGENHNGKPDSIDALWDNE